MRETDIEKLIAHAEAAAIRSFIDPSLRPAYVIGWLASEAALSHRDIDRLEGELARVRRSLAEVGH